MPMQIWSKIQEMLRRIRRKQYRRLEFKAVSWPEGDRLIRESAELPESLRWQLALPEEDFNHAFNLVCLERKEEVV